MRCFMIDYENTKDEGVKGVDSLDSKDQVFLFYSKNADRINIDTMKAIMSSKAQIHFKKIEKLGKNALDFQLCTMVGGLVGKFSGKTLDIGIISQDKGFDAITTLENEPCIPECKGTITIFRSNNITMAKKKIQHN